MPFRYYRDIIPVVTGSDYKVLTTVQALVLYVVWRGRRSGTHRPGMTNLEVQKVVETEYARSGKTKGASLPNIKKIIASLEEWRPTPLLVSARAGNHPAVYRLPKDTTITWAPSARMILLLENDSRGIVPRSVFVEGIVKLGLVNPETKQPLTMEDVEGQIDYCATREFPYVVETGSRLIKATDRVNSEREFLELIQHFED